MGRKIKKYLRIIAALQKNNLMSMMAYKQNFVIMTMAVIIFMAMNIIFLQVIFGYIQNIAGWNFYEVLLIIGSTMIIEGLLWIFGARVGALGHLIRNGELDGLLAKPADSQFLISFWECDHEDFPRVIIGIILICYGLANLNLDLETVLANLFFYLILLINAIVITYSITLLLKTIYFWTIADYSLYNFLNAMSQISQYPTDVFVNFFVKSIFTFIIPLAFAATVPAKILARGFDWKLVVGSCTVATVFFYLSRRFWQYALKHYTSASS